MLKHTEGLKFWQKCQKMFKLNLQSMNPLWAPSVRHGWDGISVGYLNMPITSPELTSKNTQVVCELQTIYSTSAKYGFWSWHETFHKKGLCFTNCLLYIKVTSHMTCCSKLQGIIWCNFFWNFFEVMLSDTNWHKLTHTWVEQVNINNWSKVIQSLWTNFCLMFKCIYHCSCDSFIFKTYSCIVRSISSLHDLKSCFEFLTSMFSSNLSNQNVLYCLVILFAMVDLNVVDYIKEWFQIKVVKNVSSWSLLTS